jgi:hypothetical protein
MTVIDDFQRVWEQIYGGGFSARIMVGVCLGSILINNMLQTENALWYG